ncbi:hypothetical protein [Endozoicomonas sp.]|uniref:hypothetical protein n=1 Tax=Endozoicomonas sp. TaxID=1892382 RepID=UPI00383BF5F0
MTTETKKCHVFVRYTNSDSIQTWMNPITTNNEIRDHYLLNASTRGSSDSDGNWFEYKVQAKSVMITRFVDDIETNRIVSVDRFTLASLTN